MTEKEDIMEDWQFNKLAAAVVKRKETIPELLKAAGIAKESLMELTKKEATSLHYYLHPEAKKTRPASTSASEITQTVLLPNKLEFAENASGAVYIKSCKVYGNALITDMESIWVKALELRRKMQENKSAYFVEKK